MKFKIFLLFASSIAFSFLAIVFSLERGQAQTTEVVHPKFHLAQSPKPAAPDEENQEDVGIDAWLLKERIIIMSGEVTPELAEKVVSQLLYLDATAPGKDIYLYINSVGGDITAGLAIYDTIRSLPHNIVTVSLGESSSMASFLLASGTRGKRLALPNSRIMIHQPLSGTWGQASDIAISAKEILYTKSLLNRLLSELTGQSLKRIEIDTDRDFYMSAQEAKGYGIVDRVINRPPSASHPLDQ